MKFSEQVVLGSTLVKFNSLVFLEDGCGCLIGMAGAAMGETALGGRQGTKRIGVLFPWLEKFRLVRCPVCRATGNSYGESISCVAYHLQVGTWTFGQAIDYIRSIEPDEVDAPETTFPVWNHAAVTA